MGAFIVKRLYYGLYVVLGVTIVVFLVTRVIGDPISTMLPMESSARTARALRPAARARSSDLPAILRVPWRGGALRSRQSLWQRRSVTEIVFERLPMTIYLVVAGMLLAIAWRYRSASVGALKPGGITDRITVVLSLLGLSIPQFWLGLLLIIVFAVDLRWLPTSGSGDLRHMVLPTITLAYPP